MTEKTSKLDWYKRNPAKFFGGTVGMRWEVKCAYSVFLDLIYDGGGSCPDDGPWIANLLGVGMSTRNWNGIKAELIGRGKLIVKDGRLYNPAASRALALQAVPTSSSPPNGPFKNRDKSAEKKPEKDATLFPDKDLTPKSDASRSSLPARASESQSLESETRRLDVIKVETIVHVDEIASILGQSRGRYWEKDFDRMLVDDDLDPVDIVDAARAHKGGPIRGLNALRGLARHKRNERTHHDPGEAAPAPATEISVEDWTISAIQLLEKGLWNDNRFGPMPGTMGYRGPQEIEARFLNVWIKQGSHPLNEMDVDDYMRKYPADFPDPGRRARWSTIAT